MSSSGSPATAPAPAPAPTPAPSSMQNMISDVSGGMSSGKQGIMGKIGKMGGMSASQLLSGGIPCKFELPMEFVCKLLFTFIIYFCVFAFIPYNGIVSKIVGYITKITNDFMKFLKTLIPSPVKKAASKIFPSFIVKYFTESIPKMIEREKEKLMTPLEVKLKKIKDEKDKRLKTQQKTLESNNSYTAKMTVYYNKQYINIKAKLISAWETFKDKIIPAIIISFIYYFIWFIFFKIIPAIFKYMFAVLQQFKQP